MKTISAKQLLNKQFTMIDIGNELRGVMGDLPSTFIGIIYAAPGSGKTEFCLRLAKALTKFGKVAWLSYEQGHSYDLKKAAQRNNMGDVSGLWRPIDPLKKLPEQKTDELFPDLLYRAFDAYLSKKNSPKYIFIDSVDYTGWTSDHFLRLRRKYEDKKGFVFIAHAKGRAPKLQISKDIEYHGQWSIYVKDYVANVVKSRFSAIHPFVIWEEEVRRRIELNPKAYPAEVHELLNGLL